MKFKVITLCGSTRFKIHWEFIKKEMTLDGNVVLGVECYGHMEQDDRIWEKKDLLDEIHKQKIDMADEVFIIDVDGYIGESTMKEIFYAASQGKKITYYSEQTRYRL